MNFRSCKYFLTVCEMGTINAAARKLYISQQSLSQHIRKLETEVGAQLLHRDNPLTLTPAGEAVKRAAQTVLDTLDQMQREIAVCQGETARELTVGMLDYGTPDFMPPLMALFLRQEPHVRLDTREFYQDDPLPMDVPLFISARELGSEFKCEVLFTDQLAVCISDQLLQRQYGEEWQAHRQRLRTGDLSALEGCPFARHWRTPLAALTEQCFEQNHFHPNYLPVTGGIQLATRLCISGQAAMTTFVGQKYNEPALPPVYVLPMRPKDIPAGYICYRNGAVLTGAARSFLEITRRYFQRTDGRIPPQPGQEA
ncbi:MAG: LysR family transcriptional regulator [Oscillospiraceae bacterium]|nr:LysR family transcriptional regulator [Oscillospiraceae bacterium]